MMTLYEFFKEEAEIMGKYANGELVEVVRCKDCKWWEGCNNVEDYVDGFCSDGERRDESEVEHTLDCPFCVRYGTDECLKNECKHLQSYKESEVEE